MDTESKPCTCQNDSSRHKELQKLCLSSDNSCTVCARLDAIDARISEAQAALEALRCERDDLASQLNHAHLSRIDRLPIEIAYIIFEFYATEQDSPLTLGAVCQRWRRIAWSTPSFWTALNVRLTRKNVSENRIQLANEWLRRSQKQPLSICLYVEHDHCDIDLDDFSQFYSLIDLLNDHAAQWQRLSVTLPRALLVRLNDMGSTTSILTSLSLYSHNRQIIDNVILTHTTPREVLIYGHWFTAKSLNWTNVTHFTASYISLHQTIEILRLSPELEHCQCDIRGQVSVPSDALRPLVHPRLKSFDIQLDGTETNLLFEIVDFPDLKKLIIHGEYGPLAIEFLSNFLQRSANKLEQLSINSFSFSGDDLVQIARSSPLLKNLDLADIASPDDLSSFYICMATHLPTNDHGLPTRSSPLLPRLQSFRWYGDTSIPWHHIALLLPPQDQSHASRRPLSLIQVCNCLDSQDDPMPYIPAAVLKQFLQHSDDIKFEFEVEFDEGQGTEDLMALSLQRTSA